MNGSEFQEIRRTLKNLTERINMLEEEIENISETILVVLVESGLIKASAEDE